MLRAKMLVESLNYRAGQDGSVVAEEVTLRAVYGPEGSANAQWSKYTPAGSLNMTISNPEAFGKIKPGQFVFVDLTITDKDS